MDCAKLTYANLDICTVEKQYIYIYAHSRYYILISWSCIYHIFRLHCTYCTRIYIYIYIYMYIYIYICTYICIYIYTCRPRNHSSSNNRLGCWENPPPLPQGGGTIWLWGGRGVGVPAHIYTSIYLYILICIHIHIDIYLLICTHTHTYIYIYNIFMVVGIHSFQPKTNYK